MKKAKVSSVYEGRGRKRSSENSSKIARMATKGRRDSVRAAKALWINTKNRTMVTRSMTVKTIEEMLINEENFCEVEVIQADENRYDYIKPMEVVQPQEEEQQPQKKEEEQPVNEVAAVVETYGADGLGPLSLNMWPMSLTTCDYEDIWPWYKVGYESGWLSYWDNVDFWTQPIRYNNRDQLDDMWDFLDE